MSEFDDANVVLCVDVDSDMNRKKKEAKLAKMADAYRTILECIGEDPNRSGVQDTPMRAAKAMEFLTGGYHLTPDDVIGSGVFCEGTENNMVIVRDIDVHSLCEHHLLPFSGKVHVGYVVGPSLEVLGLSKLSRIANMYARRLQVQERMTGQIAKDIMEATHCHGVAVLVEAAHMCMVMRGVEKVGSCTATTSFLGSFKDSAELRQEFLTLVKK